MAKKYNVGVVGATGMVGQRFLLLLEEHPLFNVTAISASPRSAGKTYAEAAAGKWHRIDGKDIPKKFADMTVDAASDVEETAKKVDFVFCAVDMPKKEIKDLEEKYAAAEVPVISNNSAHRGTPDVPMIIPEVNSEHLEIITSQRNRLRTKKGFIAVKSNCSIQAGVAALTPLLPYGLETVVLSNYQAISGAGRTFENWPEMTDNIIPFIGGEEEKTENEPLKIWGKIRGPQILSAKSPMITSQCVRVPVSDGHMSAVYIKFKGSKKLPPPISKEEILKIWSEYRGLPNEISLPSAPRKFLHYFEEENYPQTKLHRGLENGMAVSLGRLREDTSGIFDYKFIALAHNTLRGAAGGAVLLAELCAAKGLFD